MTVLRNYEVKKTFIILAVVSALAIIIAFMWQIAFGIYTSLLCAVFLAIYVGSTNRRYQKISHMADDINSLLHGDIENVSFDQYAEGELGILQSEIHKMTVRLRAQKEQLYEDKIYLANSIADISHQIRTPLTSINLLVQFLSEPNLTNERKLKLSHELYGLLSRIDWLVTALLKISKLDAGTVVLLKERISLLELIEKATAPLLVPMELREQSLHIDVCGELECDISWTCEAISNIVKNCMEHTPNGGEIHINGSENVLFTEITIRDNGCGIEKDDLPHVFERFYKGKNSDDNSFGIGLALSRMIISRQNGIIKAENNFDKGALFTMRFYKGTV